MPEGISRLSNNNVVSFALETDRANPLENITKSGMSAARVGKSDVKGIIEDNGIAAIIPATSITEQDAASRLEQIFATVRARSDLNPRHNDQVATTAAMAVSTPEGIVWRSAGDSLVMVVGDNGNVSIINESQNLSGEVISNALVAGFTNNKVSDAKGFISWQDIKTGLGTERFHLLAMSDGISSSHVGENIIQDVSALIQEAKIDFDDPNWAAKLAEAARNVDYSAQKKDDIVVVCISNPSTLNGTAVVGAFDGVGSGGAQAAHVAYAASLTTQDAFADLMDATANVELSSVGSDNAAPASQIEKTSAPQDALKNVIDALDRAIENPAEINGKPVHSPEVDAYKKWLRWQLKSYQAIQTNYQNPYYVVEKGVELEFAENLAANLEKSEEYKALRVSLESQDGVTIHDHRHEAEDYLKAVKQEHQASVQTLAADEAKTEAAQSPAKNMAEVAGAEPAIVAAPKFRFIPPGQSFAPPHADVNRTHEAAVPKPAAVQTPVASTGGGSSNRATRNSAIGVIRDNWKPILAGIAVGASVHIAFRLGATLLTGGVGYGVAALGGAVAGIATGLVQERVRNNQIRKEGGTPPKRGLNWYLVKAMVGAVGGLVGFELAQQLGPVIEQKISSWLAPTTPVEAANAAHTPPAVVPVSPEPAVAVAPIQPEPNPRLAPIAPVNPAPVAPTPPAASATPAPTPASAAAPAVPSAASAPATVASPTTAQNPNVRRVLRNLAAAAREGVTADQLNAAQLRAGAFVSGPDAASEAARPAGALAHIKAHLIPAR